MIQTGKTLRIDGIWRSCDSSSTMSSTRTYHWRSGHHTLNGKGSGNAVIDPWMLHGNETMMIVEYSPSCLFIFCQRAWSSHPWPMTKIQSTGGRYDSALPILYSWKINFHREEQPCHLEQLEHHESAQQLQLNRRRGHDGAMNQEWHLQARESGQCQWDTMMTVTREGTPLANAKQNH